MKKLTGSKRKAQKQPGLRRRRVVDDSNDTPSNVQEEIEAARLEQLSLIPRQYQDGYYSHLSDRDPQAATVGIPWRAGWLAREMRVWPDREYLDATAWPWDPSRPVTGQYEEYVAHMARGDAMPDEAIATIAHAPPRELSEQQLADLESEHVGIVEAIKSSGAAAVPQSDWQERVIDACISPATVDVLPDESKSVWLTADPAREDFIRRHSWMPDPRPADATPRVAVPVATGPEPEHGVEVAAVDCPREECTTAKECTAPYGACVVETEEPK